MTQDLPPIRRPELAYLNAILEELRAMRLLLEVVIGREINAAPKPPPALAPTKARPKAKA